MSDAPGESESQPDAKNEAETMALFHGYINRNLNLKQIDAERREQLARIGTLRKSAVITYAARLTAMPVRAPIGIMYDDLLPFTDMLANCSGDRISVILETPGGAGEVGREMVEILHERFRHVSFIVPGTAKSTGTIMVLGGDEFLMGSTSSLGPIDAQLFNDGKQYSADALIEGLKRIKDEVEQTGKLNSAFIPILQKISPGELEHAYNALQFARETVREWLALYKFSDWKKHSSDGRPVTEDDKRQRADEIAAALCSQSRWRTHGRSIRIPDLEALRLRVTNYDRERELKDAITRYHILLRMTFDAGNVYKVFETPTATLAMRFNMEVTQVEQNMPQPRSVVANVQCGKCRKSLKVQIDLQPGVPHRPGAVRYPKSGKLPCPSCNQTINLEPVRKEIEQNLGKKALDTQPTD